MSPVAPPAAPAVHRPPEAAPTIRCSDYPAHQLWHMKLSDGTWRCEVCRLDADHAEPMAEQVAFEWNFEEQPAGDVAGEGPGRRAAVARPSTPKKKGNPPA